MSEDYNRYYSMGYRDFEGGEVDVEPEELEGNEEAIAAWFDGWYAAEDEASDTEEEDEEEDEDGQTP